MKKRLFAVLLAGALVFGGAMTASADPHPSAEIGNEMLGYYDEYGNWVWYDDVLNEDVESDSEEDDSDAGAAEGGSPATGDPISVSLLVSIAAAGGMAITAKRKKA